MSVPINEQQPPAAPEAGGPAVLTSEEKGVSQGRLVLPSELTRRALRAGLTPHVADRLDLLMAPVKPHRLKRGDADITLTQHLFNFQGIANR